MKVESVGRDVPQHLNTSFSIKWMLKVSEERKTTTWSAKKFTSKLNHVYHSWKNRNLVKKNQGIFKVRKSRVLSRISYHKWTVCHVYHSWQARNLVKIQPRYFFRFENRVFCHGYHTNHQYKLENPSLNTFTTRAKQRFQNWCPQKGEHT